MDESFVEEVRKRSDIVDVASDYVQLRRSGRSYVGLCPFHNERSPSFSVSADRQMYYCFGCGAGGTVIGFVMDIEGLSFQEAILRLAERANVPIPDLGPVDHDSAIRSASQRMKEAHDLASKLYSYILMNTSAGVQALSYLQSRGLTRQTMTEFGVGYAPKDGRTIVNFLKRRGFDERLLVEAGLAVDLGGQTVDRFRDRVMIPIFDAQGAVVAFGGRSLAADAKPKYLNSPETLVFKKGLQLYHLHKARREMRRAQTAILLEGYMDVMSVWQAGVKHCVASLGTSLTEEQAVVLKRSADRLVIAYDGDAAGRKAAIRALETAQTAGLEVGVVLFPDGNDPDEFITKRGAQAFQSFLQSSVLAPVDFLIGEERVRANLSSPSGRTDFLRRALQLVAERASPIEKDRLERSLASEFGVSVAALHEELALISKDVKRSDRRQHRTSDRPAEPSRVKNGAVRAGERILQAMMASSGIAEWLMNRGVDELASPEQTALLALFYSFRADFPQGESSAFIDSLEDPALRGYASSLLIDDSPESDNRVLEDYLRTIQLHQLQANLLTCAKESDEARRRGDSELAEALGAQVEALNAAIVALKMPHDVLVGKGGGDQ
ncbi:DNA primase [Alicyclobacillus sp. ALC3]|uniref:DNA primase n=1 Tax=Alicyclobacillus sp. ALC3 TaxID=2796143 RepID=UPI00237890A1|nr:DNA primase [Alicyclobacillus sp. ALC3]WDL99599.1 DNA primase [Alicyclobacillus sp. ALC3]